MAETTETVTEQWEDQWSMVPRYERWIESLGIPIHRRYFIDHLRTIEVGPWEERECNAAIVVLTGQADFMETRVTEIPPAATLPPFKFSLDDVMVGQWHASGIRSRGPGKLANASSSGTPLDVPETTTA